MSPSPPVGSGPDTERASEGTIDPDRFRAALAHLAAGVVIVTTRDTDGEPHGMTATAVCSVSVEPPLVMVCMARDATTHGVVTRSGIFALNFLSVSGEDLARRFATQRSDKFGDVASVSGETGAPVLQGALAHCDCAVVQSVAAGDHTIFVGRVVNAGVQADPRGGPLLYYRGRYVQIGPAADQGS